MTETQHGSEMNQVIDVSFALQLAEAPLDHGYVLYGALSRALPALHEAEWLGVHPLKGRVIDGMLHLGGRPQLCLRLPLQRIPDALPLVGRTLHIGQRRAVVGVPTIHPLRPAASLDARMVAIKLTKMPRGGGRLDQLAFRQAYEQEIERQLAALGIKNRPFVLCGKRTMTIAGKRILGYAVRVSQLTDDESARLLAQGIGGRRRMGCGIFRPTRGK